MRNNIEAWWTPPEAQEYAKYLNRRQKPPLALAKLSTELLVGEEPRSKLNIPTTGEFSLLLRYKEHEGAVASYQEVDDGLYVLQLQAANGRKGYRLTTGMVWVHYLADQTVDLVEHPSTNYTRLVLPEIVYNDPGLVTTAESSYASNRYKRFAHHAGMIFSAQERVFVRDFPKPQREI